MSSDSVPPPLRPRILRQAIDGLTTLLAVPIVQWALLVLTMLALLALTKSSVAESPYNNF